MFKCKLSFAFDKNSAEPNWEHGADNTGHAMETQLILCALALNEYSERKFSGFEIL
jgi:hypothetical protein